MAARIQAELKGLLKGDTWSIELEKDNLFKWNVVFHGPVAVESPYEGGTWLVEITFPSDYPWKPPKVRFSTKIFHPNVSEKGEVCDKSYSDGWVPKSTIAAAVIPFIENLLAEPDSENAMNARASELLSRDPKAFKVKAKEWTEKYAM